MLRDKTCCVALLLCGVVFLQVQCLPAGVDIVQPKRSMRCNSTDDPCKINLTVSYMQTLNAYCVNSDRSRGSDSVPVNITKDGEFELVYGDNFINKTCTHDKTRVFQPIVGDGISKRNLLVINDQLPGPVLIGYKNQRVQITVRNDLGKEAITLHWHGQHVNGSQHMDGVPFVTQCPIQPGDSFVYDFHLFPAGTYWYHSHQYDERSDGMYGALIVLDQDAPQPDPRFDVDEPEQHTIAFFEWFPVNSNDWIGAPFRLADPTNPMVPYEPIPTYDGSGSGGGDPPFIAGLMNYGGWRYTPSADDCQRVANTSLTFFNVTRGMSYRFRLIGSQINFAYRFSISGHSLRVIATDGIDATVPSSITELVDFIIVHVGERYDFVLEANRTVDNYLMVAETLENPEMLRSRNYCIKAHRVYGVLHYDGASDTLPDDFDDSYDPLTRCTPSDQCFALNCPFQIYSSNLNIRCISVMDLQLSNPQPVPSDDVKSHFLTFGFANGPSINGRVFDVPTSPLLTQADETIAAGLFCLADDPPYNPIDGTKVLRPTCVNHINVITNTSEFVYVNIPPNGGTSHPVHLHGHHYFVLDIGYPSYYENGTINSTNSNIMCSENNSTTNLMWCDNNTAPISTCMATNTCVLKDTVIVPVGGYVRIRFPRNNWGWWIMHCHIEPHLLGGMALVVNETSFQGNVAPLPAGFPVCGDFPPKDLIPPSEVELREINEDQFRDSTIALGVISGLLLLALIVVIIILVGVCFHFKGHSGGGGSSSRKVEVELK